MTSGQRVVLAIALICIGGASGFFTARFAGMRKTQAMAEAPPRRVSSASGGPQSARGPSEAAPDGRRPIPVNLPDIALADADGVKHALSEWKGRPLLINFWATWCAPCRREIPLLKTLRHERAADGIEVVGIAVDFRDAVQRYAREMGIDYPVLIGEQDGLDAISAFGMEAVFPFTVFVDRRGRIVTLKIGELHADEAHLILDQVNEVDRGRIDLTAAKKAISDGAVDLATHRAQAETKDSGGGPPDDLRKSNHEVP